MVYKRTAQVLFVGSGDNCRALMAVAFAHALGWKYMTARAVGLQVGGGLPSSFLQVMEEAGLDVSNQTLHALSVENLAWADLVVTLDAAANQACATLSSEMQQRFYSFPEPGNDLEALRQTREAIRQRVVGMLGGMAMIA